LPSAIAIAIALAVSHCRLDHHQPLQLPSLSAITVPIAIGHCQEFLPWRGKNCIQTILANNACLILFFLTVGGALIKAG
jgi:hypothetical protein